MTRSSQTESTSWGAGISTVPVVSRAERDVVSESAFGTPPRPVSTDSVIGTGAAGQSLTRTATNSCRRETGTTSAPQQAAVLPGADVEVGVEDVGHHRARTGRDECGVVEEAREQRGHTVDRCPTGLGDGGHQGTVAVGGPRSGHRASPRDRACLSSHFFG